MSNFLIGSIETRRGATGDTYRLAWREKGEKQHSPTFDSIEDCERFQAILSGDRARGIYYNPMLPKTQFGVVAEKWLRLRVNTPAYRVLGSKLRCRILPYWRKYEVGAITYGEVQHWVNLLSPRDEDDEEYDADEIAALPRHLRPVSPAYVEGLFITLRQVIRFAEIERMLPMGNPIRGAIALPSDVDRRRFLTHKEKDDLLAGVRKRFPEWYPVVYVAAYTGMRIGEVFALERSHYNPLLKQLTIAQAWKANDRLGKPKGNRPRTIGIDKNLIKVINAQLAAHDGSFIFPVTGHVGTPVQQFQRRHWPIVKRELGVELRFHDLRHTHISHLLMAGVTPHEVAAIVGHRSTRMTMDRYGHFVPGGNITALEKLHASRVEFA